MTEILLFLAGFFVSGLVFTVATVTVHEQKDNESWLSYLIFPGSHIKGVVGEDPDLFPQDPRVFLLWPLIAFFCLTRAIILLPQKRKLDAQRKLKEIMADPARRHHALLEQRSLLEKQIAEYEAHQEIERLLGK